MTIWRFRSTMALLNKQHSVHSPTWWQTRCLLQRACPHPLRLWVDRKHRHELKYTTQFDLTFTLTELTPELNESTKQGGKAFPKAAACTAHCRRRLFLDRTAPDHMTSRFNFIQRPVLAQTASATKAQVDEACRTEVDQPKAALTDDFPQPPSRLVAGVQDEAFWEWFG